MSDHHIMTLLLAFVLMIFFCCSLRRISGALNSQGEYYERRKFAEKLRKREVTLDGVQVEK